LRPAAGAAARRRNPQPGGAFRPPEVTVTTFLAPPAPLGRQELTAALFPGETPPPLTALLAELNAPQRAAATRPDGPLVVVAGPGAGKTRVIVARIAYLLLERGVPPEAALAITFSRRAAGELQSRLAALLGPLLPAGAGVWAGTFHALGARLLRRGGAAHFERPLNFTIYDADDAEQALRRVLAALGVPANRAGRLAAAARPAISLVKRQAPGDAGVLDEVTVGEGAEAIPLRDVLSRYGAALREAAAFDFDDLVACATEALDRDPALRAWAQARTRHLLVDEYQDTDAAQEALLRRLSPPASKGPGRSGPPGGRDLCVVADPQQSIYAFRGAVPQQVQRFVALWPGASVVRLEQNYRSTKSIVALARRLTAAASLPAGGEAASPGAAPTAGRLALRLWTANPAGAPARLWIAPHPEKEADAIARDIATRLKGDAPWAPEEIAILVRTHAQARPIESALLRAGVPYALFGGIRFFEREEVKDALAYLRLSLLREDGAAFWRIVNTPRRGLGPAALLTIARFALTGTSAGPRTEIDRDRGSDLSRGAVAGARRWAATEGAPDGLYDLLAHVDELTGLGNAGEGPATLIETALQRTGYRDYVRREHPDDAPARLDALAELVRLATGYDDSRRFLDDAVLSGDEDDPLAPAPGRVRLSTVHAAKGLEFRAVYVPGCEVGLFPLGSRREGDSQNLDPEERRIFYVAVTRAREQLTFSYCTFRRDERTQPSPFLAEIGRGLLRRARLGSDEPPPRRRPPAGRGLAEPAAPDEGAPAVPASPARPAGSAVDR
jgi:DNA helicase-2/ATP-dependent DNA helicase PcrA